MEINWKIFLELFSKLLVLHKLFMLFFFLKKIPFRILSQQGNNVKVRNNYSHRRYKYTTHCSVWMSCQHYSLLFVRNIPPPKANTFIPMYSEIFFLFSECKTKCFMSHNKSLKLYLYIQEEITQLCCHKNFFTVFTLRDWRKSCWICFWWLDQ